MLKLKTNAAHAAFLLALAVTPLAPTTARSACLPPTPPDLAAKPAKLVPPAKPPCADNPMGPGCLGTEAFSYNDAIKAYNARIPTYQAAANAYVAKLNAYVQASGEYARCEAESLR